MAPPEMPEQRCKEYDLGGDWYFEQSRVKIIPGKRAKRAVVMIHVDLAGHVKVSPSLSHSLLELAQIQSLEIRHWQWKWKMSNDWRGLDRFEESVLKRVF